MTEEMIRPKVCAVCGQVCDQYAAPGMPVEWVHVADVLGVPDHVTIPIDYDLMPVVARCDFCYRVVPFKDLWTVPADDFVVPIIGANSMGGWACDQTCAEIAGRRDWPAMIERHLASPESKMPDSPPYREFLRLLYDVLEANMTDGARAWRAGDEMVRADGR